MPIAIDRALDEKFIRNAHKKAEEDLAKEQYLMKTLMDNVPDFIYFKNLKSEFIKVNKSLANYLYSVKKCDAIYKTDFDFFDKEYAQRSFDDEQGIIKTGIQIIGKEENFILEDGSVIWMSIMKMPLYSDEGKIIGTFGISKNITERKIAEDEIAKKVSDLEYYHTFVVNRELKMIELKGEINSLLSELGRSEKYP